jgi:chromosome partitioning protein
MANILSIVSSKGGAGKTTVALNLAVALAESGENTLLVDVDPLGAIGFSLAQSDTEWTGLAECMIAKLTIDEVIMPTKLPTLSLLPRGRLDPLDVGIYEELLHSSAALSEVIAAVENRFRYIIIDTPSGLGKITRAALSVSDFVLLPLQAEPLALRSISQTLRVLMHVKEHENPSLELLGILATMVQLKKDVSFNIMKTVWGSLNGVLENYMPRADVFSAASERGLPVAFLPGPYSPEAVRFQLLVTELKGIIQSLGGETGETDDRPQRELI